MRKGPQQDKELDENPSADGSEELYERLNLTVDKGQEPCASINFHDGTYESISLQ